MEGTLGLFPDSSNQLDKSRNKMGHATVNYYEASSLVTKSTGFLDAFDYSLNPYSGCSFGCTYCYAAAFSKTDEKKQAWGKWVDVKENALLLLQKLRNKPLIDKTIYISSVTDPYQPIERELGITKSILEELLKYHRAKIVIQTRSPLIERDIDLLKGFGPNVQVNMTITTDSENVRKAFEPFCPSNETRLAAIKKIASAGIKSCITMTPLLPVKNVVMFADQLRSTGVNNFIAQTFHSSSKEFTATTPEGAKELMKEMSWTPQKQTDTIAALKKLIPNLQYGREGFKPKFSNRIA